MQANRFRWLGMLPFLGLVVNSADARGQGARPWVDPPRQIPMTAPAPTNAPERSSSPVPPNETGPTIPPAPVSAPDPSPDPAPRPLAAGAVDAVPLPNAAPQVLDGATAQPANRAEPPPQPDEASLSTAPLEDDEARDKPGAARAARPNRAVEGQSSEPSARSSRAQEPRKAKRHGGRAVARFRSGVSPFAKIFGPPRRGAGIINNSSATR